MSKLVVKSKKAVKAIIRFEDGYEIEQIILTKKKNYDKLPKMLRKYFSNS